MAAPKVTKTRILIISDTHSTELNPEDDKRPFRKPLPKADVLLHCGDLTMIGHLEEYKKAIEMMRNIDAELKLVIAGNHDISLDKDYFEREGMRMHRQKWDRNCSEKALEMWKGDYAKSTGITYLEEGTYEFTISNGAKFSVYASPYQPEFCNWAFPYERHEDRYNPPNRVAWEARAIAQNPIPDFPNVDIVMTHGPPFGRLDTTVFSGEHVGCSHLLSAMRRAKPRLHCFGHIHEGWGAERVVWSKGSSAQSFVSGSSDVKVANRVPVDEDKMNADRCAYVDVSSDGAEPLRRGEETLMVNASIMNAHYRPVNGPWLVDLDLPAV
ncbi:hypothetical protein H2201_004337 [Coniosporium apollinis]|uniref:Calcineurin-like phosphoesterase domain-containing protein n=2 Tax=Coniosporium TaxID=2810619 RepID=A0ABQ9NTC0_9PEZI|nr:hypothetical protein H2199_000106 [Cladosporium sp. JES 115]KAJ9665645.1 hypothetical protein H2201_004337 [Coniosporium apollinis]